MISLFEKKTHGFYHNTSIVISEKGKILSKYRKMHIPCLLYTSDAADE